MFNSLLANFLIITLKNEHITTILKKSEQIILSPLFGHYKH